MVTLQPQSVLQGGRYIIKRVLGQGGFGITYEGVQAGLDRRVAIKEFFMKDYCERDGADGHVTAATTGGLRELVDSFREKFVKEAQLIASLDDAPHIVDIYDIFEDNDTAYYVMEFVEGGSLQEQVRRNGVFTEMQAVNVVCQTAEALEILHSQQTMHLDVKPSNILLRQDLQGRDDVVLIDFGVSKHYDQSGHQTTSTPVGISKGYAPFEQYREGGVSEFSPTADVYSLGATLYYLLTGTTPPEAAVLLSAPLSQPPGISDAMWQIICKAMSVRPCDRYQSMSEMKAALQPLIGSTVVHRHEPTVDTEVPKTESSDTLFSQQPIDDTVSTQEAEADARLVPARKKRWFSAERWGYQDRDTGQVVIPCEWKEVAPFSNGLGRVKDFEDHYGLIDRTGQVVTPCKWLNVITFSGGLARVQDVQGNWGFINRRGEEVILCQWKMAEHFRENLARVQDDSGKWGFVDRQGRMVILFLWKNAMSFSNGLARVQDEKKKWGFINHVGMPVIPCRFKNAHSFNEGLAAFTESKNKWGFIDTKGRMVIVAKWRSVLSFSEGLACVQDETEMWGYINPKGEVVIPCKWKEAQPFHNGRARVKNRNLNAFVIDVNGLVVEKE